jgi:hypothetical protein
MPSTSTLQNIITINIDKIHLIPSLNIRQEGMVEVVGEGPRAARDARVRGAHRDGVA